MTRIIKAIFERGLLRPLEPLDLPENSQVDVTIESASGIRGPGFNGCAGTISTQDAAELRAIVEREFEQVNQRDW